MSSSARVGEVKAEVMEPTCLDGFSEGRWSKCLHHPDRSFTHRSLTRHSQTLSGTSKSEMWALKPAYRARRISSEVTLRQPAWQRRTARWEDSSLRPTRRCSETRCLPQLLLPRRWSLPGMLRPRSSCWSGSAHRRHWVGTGSEKSGCQAPPRKQKARGSVDVDQGRDGQQWDCSQSLRRAAEPTEGGWCTRVIPVADNHRWFLPIFSPDMKTLRHFPPIPCQSVWV